MTKREKIVIVGAGVAGLTIADILSSQPQFKVTVIEKEAKMGGLARSFYFKEGFIFDIGPHRFHTDDIKVLRYIKEVLREYITINRSSGVYMFNKYFDWPLRPKALLQLPLLTLIKVGLEFLFKIFKKQRQDDSFYNYIINIYGNTLFNLFFAPYHEKFLKISAKETHKNWAISGVNRAVIDKRVNVNSLLNLLKTTLFPIPVKTTFIYPNKGGIDSFCQKQAIRIRKNGGEIITSDEIVSIERNNEKIIRVKTKKGKSVLCDKLIWTAPLPTLSKLLDEKDRGLKYLHTILYLFEIDGKPSINYQWCYFGSKDIPFIRTTIPSLFAQHTVPRGSFGICAEVTAAGKEKYWQNPKILIDKIVENLIRVGLIKEKSNIQKLYIKKIPNTYPVYSIDYLKKIDSTIQDLSKYKNLRLLGRCGMFWYNNMDHSIKAAMVLARNMINKKDKAPSIDYKKIF